MAESEEELKVLLMKVKEESEKVDLKPNIQKTKIVASGSITSWQIDGETGNSIKVKDRSQACIQLCSYTCSGWKCAFRDALRT